MEKILIRKNVQVNYNADDWDLYTETPNVELAALALNRCFEESVNKGLTRSEVESAMGRKMTEFRHFGCSDSEPYHVLDRLLNKTFGQD